MLQSLGKVFGIDEAVAWDFLIIVIDVEVFDCGAKSLNYDLRTTSKSRHYFAKL